MIQFIDYFEYFQNTTKFEFLKKKLSLSSRDTETHLK